MKPSSWDFLIPAVGEVLSNPLNLVFPQETALSIEDLNDLSPYPIYPLGIITKKANVDGINYDPPPFMAHDIIHWGIIKRAFTRLYPNMRMLKAVRVLSLEEREFFYNRFKAELTKHDAATQRAAHVMYFLLTHEERPLLGENDEVIVGGGKLESPYQLVAPFFMNQTGGDPTGHLYAELRAKRFKLDKAATNKIDEAAALLNSLIRNHFKEEWEDYAAAEKEK